MALINCPECGKEISDRAPDCIHCGCPIAKDNTTVKSDEKKKFKVEFKGAEVINERVLPAIKTLDKKTWIIIAAVLAAVIIGIVVISSLASSGAFESISANEIVLDEVHKINGIGELEIKRVATTKHLMEDVPSGKTLVDFECDFTNTTGESYALSDLASMTAKSKANDAVYTVCEVGEKGNSYIHTVNADPNVKTRVHFVLQVPEDEKELIVTLSFGEETLSFRYTVGDLLRNAQVIKPGDKVEVDGVATLDFSAVAYSNCVCAPEPYSGRTHRAYEVDDYEDTVYLIFDTQYTNLREINSVPEDNVYYEAIYDGKYYYTQESFFTFNWDGENISSYQHDSEFVPNSEQRVCMVVEVSKKMIDKEVEVDFFIGDKEFIYKGTPEYVKGYGT